MGKSTGHLASPMAFSSPQHFERWDILRMARAEHHRLKDIMSTIVHTPGLSYRERHALAHQFLRDASRTTAAEEAVLLPLLRRYSDYLPSVLVERAADRRAFLKRQLAVLDQAPLSDVSLDAKVSACWIAASSAFNELDQRFLPLIDRHCPPQVKTAAGRAFYLYRHLLAPTRPHTLLVPTAGAAGSPLPGNAFGSACSAMMGALVAPVDWARDVARWGVATPV